MAIIVASGLLVAGVLYYLLYFKYILTLDFNFYCVIFTNNYI
jgi:hypothetical protein